MAFRISIVGGGLVGMATALDLSTRFPEARVTLHEKESRVGRHQSTHNSGVLHAGLYYKPGSLKAQLAVAGIRRMVEFCREHGVRHEICGKVVVATDEAEIERLRVLMDRGARNGLAGLRWLDATQLRAIEPHAAGVAAVHVPEEGIVDYAGVCEAMRRVLIGRGVAVRTNSRVTSIRASLSGYVLTATTATDECDFLVNCGGLYSDVVARLAGESPDVRIVPFRGEYYGLIPSAQRLVRHLIYPVPDPVFPFLGVHFTRLIGGGVEAGPNAVLAAGREGYTKTHVRPSELADALGFPGLWRFMREHRAMAWQEVRRSFSRRLFCASLQRLVPELRESDLAHGGAGVRAQAMRADGTLVQDFEFLERPHALHVLNAPSPAATASLAIGEYIGNKVAVLVGAEHVTV